MILTYFPNKLKGQFANPLIIRRIASIGTGAVLKTAILSGYAGSSPASSAVCVSFLFFILLSFWSIFLFLESQIEIFSRRYNDCGVISAFRCAETNRFEKSTKFQMWKKNWKTIVKFHITSIILWCKKFNVLWNVGMNVNVRVAKLVGALDLGSSIERCVGSSPTLDTI